LLPLNLKIINFIWFGNKLIEEGADMKIGNLEVYGIIYRITNIVNGKVYIGQTAQEGGFYKRYNYKGTGIERVYNYHKGRLKRKLDANKHLLSSIKTHGFKAFEIVEVFDIAFSQEELNIKEQCWISYYDSDNRKYGYNKNIGGGSGCGFQHTEESKNKNRISKLEVSLPVICVNTNETFLSLKQAGKKYNIDRKTISLACKGEYRYAGLNPITGEKMVWMYLNDYTIHKAEERMEDIELNVQFKKVVCLNNRKIFLSIGDANTYCGFRKDSGTIGKCCRGLQSTSGRFPDGTRLIWAYYEDYIHMTDIDIQNKINSIKKMNIENYIKKEVKKKVICTTFNIVFNSIAGAGKFYHIDNAHIGNCCQGKQKYSGKLFDGTKLQWKYIEDLTPEDIKYDIENKLKELYNQDYTYDSKTIVYCKEKYVCVTTNKKFNTIKEAGEYYKIISYRHINSCCNGTRIYCGKLEDGTPLKWKYSDEYIKQKELLHNENLGQAI